jgi:hypothetical protein
VDAYKFFESTSFRQKTTAIDLTLRQHGFTKLSTVPMYAAFIPMWPEYLASVLIAVFFFARTSVI